MNRVKQRQRKSGSPFKIINVAYYSFLERNNPLFSPRRYLHGTQYCRYNAPCAHWVTKPNILEDLFSFFLKALRYFSSVTEFKLTITIFPGMVYYGVFPPPNSLSSKGQCDGSYQVEGGGAGDQTYNRKFKVPFLLSQNRVHFSCT